MPSRLIRRSRPFTATKVCCLDGFGQCLMSAEMALEFLPEEQRDRCICAKHHSWRARSRQQWRLLWRHKQVLAEARRRAQSSAMGIVSNTSSVVWRTRTTDKGQQTRNPTDCSQSFRITRPKRLNSLRQQPVFSPNQGAELNEDTEPARAESINQVATLGVRQGHELAISSRL